MLEYPHASMDVGGAYRNDISVMHENSDNQQRTIHEIDESKGTKFRQWLKKTAQFLFSHIGLVGLVGVYSVAGGFLFELLEQHQDQLNCQEAQGEQGATLMKLKQTIVAYIQYNTTAPNAAANSSYSSSEKDNQTVAVTNIGAMLTDFRTFVIDTTSTYRYTGDNCTLINKWTFPNSLLFAITIITTIGYGNITPVTWEGQICCICYATIGIPIFLLCVANISGVLGEMFRFLYGRVLCKPCDIIKRRRALARKSKLERDTGIDGSRGNNGGWAIDDQQHPENNNKNGLKKSPNAPINNSPEMDDEEQQLRNQRVTVPLTITMLIIAAYIWAGSMIFHSFETWTMTQAGYFCFITLATIGFGDFVPGQTKDDPNATMKLIVGCIYVLFGMAILAMCFDLMQEEIVAKFRWIGRKIGIIEKEDPPAAAPNDKAAGNSVNNNSSNQRRPSTGSSILRPSPTGNTPDKILDEDNDRNWPSRRSSSGTRKLSPRNNTARVHPMATASNEGTLHQRAPTSKQH